MKNEKIKKYDSNRSIYQQIFSSIITESFFRR